jgi:glutamine amidotransferase
MRSVHKALLKAGAAVRVVTAPEEIEGADGVVLPGVGAFDDCLNALARQRLLDCCRAYVATGRPFLGICVGYQALFERSEVFNSCASGLAVFKGSVTRFTHKNGLKIPQIGWNQLRIAQPNCPLYHDIPDGSYVYFVHSYYPSPADTSLVATWTDYGDSFASSIWRENVFGTQFHPEKSQKVGLKLLRNFIELANGG